MPHQLVDVIYLPFVTGLVGYLTNKLAIKMLFRPYKARWYTLGWQGVVPRTRPMLAEKISQVVSKKLIAHDDILSVISGDDFRIFLQNAVSSKLAKITGEDIEKIFSGVNINEALKENSEAIDKAGLKIIEGFMSKPVSDFIRPEAAAETAAKAATPEISKFLASEISGFINNFVYSGKTLENALPEALLKKTDDMAVYLTGSATNVIKASGRSAAVKETIAEKVIEFKNSFFGGGGSDMLKMGLLNMFLNDETIANTVKRELPAFMDGVAENPEVLESIKTNIKNEIEKILNLKISELADKAGEGFLPSLSAGLASRLSAPREVEKIRAAVKNMVLKIGESFSSLTVEEALEKAGAGGMIKKFSLSEYLLSADTEKFKKSISETAAAYINARSREIALPVTAKIMEILKANLAPILESINIEKTVKDKINTLSLSEVEDILFSFMRTHFKWINILGFVIGFVIGCVQLIITKLI